LSHTPKTDAQARAVALRQNPFVGVAIATIAMGLAFAAGAPSSQMPRLPAGRAVGAVAFDCLIQANAPIAEEKSAFFLTYAVSPQAVAYDIIWAEPCWQTSNFPCPPAGLSVRADASAFRARHALNDVDWNHALPTAARGRFDHTCNNYPLEESRFAFQESLAKRISTEDLPALESSFLGVNRSNAAQRPADMSPFGEPLPDRPGRPLTTGDMSNDSSEGTKLTFWTLAPREYREFGYRFDEGKLQSMFGVLGEMTVPVGGFEIRAEGPEFPQGAIISQLPARRHPGGRDIQMTFDEANVNGIAVDLPSEIMVQQLSPRQSIPFLRRATISNYRALPSMPLPEALGTAFTTDPLFDREQEFRKLLARHWKHPTDTVPGEDAAWLGTFAAECERLIATEPRLPIRLKLRFMSISSDLMTGQHERADTKGFPAYLAELRSIGLADIADRAAEQFAALRAEWGSVD